MFKLLEKYRSIKADYLSRSPRGKWEFVRNIGIFVLKLTGVPVLDPNYELYWYSFAPMLCGINIFLSFCYTIWYYKETPITGFFGYSAVIRCFFKEIVILYSFVLGLSELYYYKFFCNRSCYHFLYHCQFSFTCM